MADSSQILIKLGALVRLVREIGIAREAKEIYEPTLHALEAIVGIERSAILLLDDAGIARFVAWRGLSDDYRTAVEGHFPWALDDPSPQPILVEDVEQAERLMLLAPLLANEGIRALAFIPLIYRGRVIGKFMLYRAEAHRFSDEEIELANTLASLIAFAIERTRLYTALEEADRRKDVFLATLAHELRNPLAPAAAGIALMKENPGDLAIVRKVQDVLERSIGQIVKLVDELLDVSRITRGMITIDKKPVDLVQIVHHAIVPVEPLIASQQQELTLSLEPLAVKADALRLEQVITNLIGNAAKYTPSGGHIAVSTRPRDSGVEIRVRDDGIGLEPGVIPKLFDLFVQVDRTLARTRGGLGVGLTIVRELVQLHGGTVRATSEGLGYGAEFTVWLPGRIEAHATPAADTHRPHGPSRKILVVDDNEDAATTLAMLLEAWGHDVSIAANGTAAIAAVATQHPQVVLLDLGLPGLSGYDVARALRVAGEALRIVAVSGYGQPEDVARARAAGCDAHLAKPVDLRALEQILTEAPEPIANQRRHA